MKSRSRRFPLSEPRHDDWVNGSWTVDCVCGVNFDDGEEMVDCDECGVWVHTRCSRYVKSEKSFACHKCKSKNTGGGSSIRNDSEETEVAEFLLELPMKTLRMDNPNPSTVSSRGQFRLWSDVPMDERVHVQGVPGGEPGFFSGIKMNSIFGPNLWKCTGYVPKKFNFRYTEFPCASDGEFEEKKVEETDSSSDEENANQADNGAGTLLSLLKVNKNTSPTPIVDSCVMKSPVESGTSLDIVSPRQKKKWGGDNLDSQFPEDSLKKDSTSVKPPTMLHPGKHKKEELGMSKDQSLKKKVKTTEKEGNDGNHSAHASKIASKFSNDGKQLEVSEDRGSMAVSDDTICGKDDVGECATNLASNERDPEITLRNDVANDDILKDRNKGLVPARSADFSSANSVMVSLTEINSSHSMPAKEKVRIHTLHRRENFGEVNGSAGVVSHDKEPVAVNVKITSSEAKESENVQLSDIDETNSQPNIKLKAEVDVDDHGGHHTRLLVTDVNLDTTKVMTHHPEPSTHLFSEEGKVIETSIVSSEAIDHKLHDGSRSLTVACSNNDKSDESPPITYLSKRKPASSEVSEKLHKSSVKVTTHSIASYQRKVVVSEGKSASNSGTKSSSQRVSATAQKPPTDSKQNELSESDVGTIRDDTCTNTVKEEEKSGRPRKFVKEPSRLHSHPKIPQSTKLSHTSDSTPVSGVCVSPPQMEGVSHVQNKAVPGKGEKSYQSGSQPSSRGHMTSSASPSVPAMSDEELALLLHQELNSSPRVPRVPRMRHAGSLPQLTSPTATSTLMKRTSSSGGKDQGVPFRRRTKDFSREGSHSSVEVDNETKKLEKKPSSPDNRKQDSRCNVDSVSRREADGGSVKAVHHKTTNVSSSLSSSGDANGHNVSSNRPSSRNTSDENPRAVGRLTNHTLPGLIAEIMSEGKRMTYEELCNAVLPHWPHLRKHNGERYAYSSHSQAVLDCLRNRSEWARLVDRGPKTSGSRKRHKDGDFESLESEDNEDKRVKKAKDIGCSPHQEDFPKGKRKARKRRRLALHGRGVVGRRRRADVVSDDESESFSNSSEEEEEEDEDRMSSEEETQARGTSVTVGNEDSSSSEDASTSSDESR